MLGSELHEETKHILDSQDTGNGTVWAAPYENPSCGNKGIAHNFSVFSKTKAWWRGIFDPNFK
jgi:hypothetical protein